LTVKALTIIIIIYVIAVIAEICGKCPIFSLSLHARFFLSLEKKDFPALFGFSD
jgi:hypothetical protein